MPRKLDAKLRRQCLKLLAKHSVSVVHDVTGVSKATLAKWRREYGVPTPQRVSKNSDTAANYTKAKRMELNNKLFKALEGLLIEAETAKSLATRSNVLKNAALTYAILTDKRRVEEGRNADGDRMPELPAGGVKGVLELANKRRAELTAGTGATHEGADDAEVAS